MLDYVMALSIMVLLAICGLAFLALGQASRTLPIGRRKLVGVVAALGHLLVSVGFVCYSGYVLLSEFPRIFRIISHYWEQFGGVAFATIAAFFLMTAGLVLYFGRRKNQLSIARKQ